MRIASWNIQRSDEPWRILAANKSIDLALVQEAKPPPADVTCEVVPARHERWTMTGYDRTFRTAIARMSDRVRIRNRFTVDLNESSGKAMGISRDGTLTVVDVENGDEVITCISAYAVWQSVVSDAPRPWIISDASAHRIVSDVSTLISAQDGHRLIVAGDFNILRGYGENGSPYWSRRYATVFDRMTALGLRCVGPSAPNGRQADPWPEELPKDSKNVPTYHSSHQDAATATRQLDYVFASEGIADRLRVRALNGIDEWGRSDHCRVLIDVSDHA